MKIQIERSGGFTGIIKKITVDTENLPKDIANNIEKNLSKTKLANRLTYNKKSRVPDCYYYKISTHRGKNKQNIEFSEFDIDKELRTMVNSLFKKNQDDVN
jgi:hypothetical protein